ncbi:MAG: prephenate dehydrogenase/arogenate dehydrogenase family protein [Deltaproteobacteria bacterium]|nr:prephenate dehydrogenase/arogenate dehydrogenase family protein [Deltaproteobacteria bacterium]
MILTVSPPGDSLQSLLVLGGGDGIGLWLAKRLFARIPGMGRITLADVKPIARRGAQERAVPGPQHALELATLDAPLDAMRLDYTCAGDSLAADWAALPTKAPPPAEPLPLEAYRLVMLAVPEEAIEQAAAAVLPYLHPGTQVFDVCSTKAVALPAMLRHAPEGVSVLGTHPLFGPAVPDLVGQVMVMTPTPRTDHVFYAWYRDLVRSFGAVVEEVPAHDHDLHMLFIQTLAHFSYLVFGRTLTQAAPMGFSLAESFKVSTPPYGILAAFTARIIGGNPRLYAQIQAQPGADTVRALFLQAARDLASQFSGSQAQVQAAIQEVIDSYKGSDVARAYANSRALVDSVQQSYRELYRRKQSGQLTVLDAGDPLNSAESSVTHVGLVADVDGQSVELVERVAQAADGKWFIAYDAQSEAALRKNGRSLRPRTSHILRHNIRRVLSAEETIAWRRTNLVHHQRDISVLTDQAVDMAYLCDVLAKINPVVVSGQVLEPAEGTWLKRYDLRNQLVRLTIFGDRDPDACVAEVVHSLRLFGVWVG